MARNHHEPIIMNPMKNVCAKTGIFSSFDRHRRSCKGPANVYVHKTNIKHVGILANSSTLLYQGQKFLSKKTSGQQQTITMTIIIIIDQSVFILCQKVLYKLKCFYQIEAIGYRVYETAP